MNKEFIHYEEALALKELGFDEPCFGFYYPNGKLIQIHTIGFPDDKKDCILAPLYQQAIKWFREKYRLQPSVNSFCFEEYSFVIMGSRNEILYPIHHKLLNDGKKNPWEFDTYEEAELACLKKLIEIVKENKQ